MADQRITIVLQDASGRPLSGQVPQAPSQQAPTAAGRSTSVAASQASGQPVMAQSDRNEEGREQERQERYASTMRRYWLNEEHVAESHREREREAAQARAQQLQESRQREREAQRAQEQEEADARPSRAAPDEPTNQERYFERATERRHREEADVLNRLASDRSTRTPDSQLSVDEMLAQDAQDRQRSDLEFAQRHQHDWENMGEAEPVEANPLMSLGPIMAIAGAIRVAAEAIVSAMKAASDYIREEGKIVAEVAGNETIKAEQSQLKRINDAVRSAGFFGRAAATGAELVGITERDVAIQNRETFRKHLERLAPFGGEAASAAAQNRAAEIQRNLAEASILGNRMGNLSAADRQLQMLETQNAILDKAAKMQETYNDTNNKILQQQELLNAKLAQVDEKLAEQVKAMKPKSTALDAIVEGIIRTPFDSQTGMENLRGVEEASHIPPIVAGPVFGGR